MNRRMVRGLFTSAFLILAMHTCSVTGIAQTLDEHAMKGMEWRQIGPFRGGRVLAVTGVSGEANTYYFGAVAGGV